MKHLREEYKAIAAGNKKMEMLAVALELLAVAPADERAHEWAYMANVLESLMSHKQIEMCKAAVSDVLSHSHSLARNLVATNLLH